MEQAKEPQGQPIRMSDQNAKGMQKKHTFVLRWFMFFDRVHKIVQIAIPELVDLLPRLLARGKNLENVFDVAFHGFDHLHDLNKREKNNRAVQKVAEFQEESDQRGK
jgi:hypothetical protein